ncbi:hypothetical protein [Tensaw virus]|uniref:Uncharacterized protein n=1 Tax=Tensaw virus TaxID=273347 RepID=C8YZ44_9VIRU|nr:hypothetical protein [Tensaw virus]ACV95622.1 hypothetical protein [Tensaw virus]
MVKKCTCHSFLDRKCSLEHLNSTHWQLAFTRCKGRRWNPNIWKKQCGRDTWAWRLLPGQSARLMKSSLHSQ